MKPEEPHRFHSVRPGWIVAALLAAALPWAAAQTCNAPLPSPGASAPDNGEKFRLIAGQCTGIGAPAQPRRAAQLDLYGAGAVSFALPAEAPAAERTDEFTARIAGPVDGDAGRVLSLAPAVTAAAQAYGIDPLLLHAIAHVESRHRAGAVSPAGARGVMQVMPDTARRFGVGDPERTLFDPATNLRASAAYLRTLRERYGNDLRLVLAAYNAGEGAVQKHGNDVPPYPETQAYVRDVLAIYRRLTASFAVTPTGTLVARGASGSPR
jgi:soluble lytic murein transglycosylase-like protein